jgi:phospholipase C
MRFIVKSLLLLVSAATLAFPQTNNIPQIQHVIVVVQENRTPDNLFGSDAFASPHQLPGADLVQNGSCYLGATSSIQLQPLNLGNACDPNHGHKDAWNGTYHGGAMDGACTIGTTGCSGSTPEYTYVQSSNVVPYFNIAKQFGYSNYMFQTSQGPSFPAHQFLLSGTSAPIYDDGDSNDYWKWFAAENSNSQSEKDYGCTALDTVILEAPPSGAESAGYGNGYPCYTHNTLATLLDSQPSPISWKYYSQGGAAGLWTAPNAISGICGLSQDKTKCNGSEWNNNVKSVFPNSAGYPNSFSPILTDLGADLHQQQCTLPAVSWVVPDGSWSDHAGLDPNGAGPAWVSAIVNAVGGYDNSNNKLPTKCGYWANTVVLITWDDWGGWYDHVSPAAAAHGPGIGYPNQTGGQYVYGFRVPLLVVSAYSKQGYISGALPSPGEVPPYIHDFGSILNFIEYAFGSGGNFLSLPGQLNKGISPSYSYADVLAPDAPASCSQCKYSLSDFFNFNNQRTFTNFTQGINYATQCFLIPEIPTCFGPSFAPSDPDADAVDEQD